MNRVYMIQSDDNGKIETTDYALSLEAADRVLVAQGYVCTQKMDDETNSSQTYEKPDDFLFKGGRARIIWVPALA